MFGKSLGLICIAALGFQGSAAAAQSASAQQETPPCDAACKQTKLDALFKAMHDADMSRHPRPSRSMACPAYRERDLPEVLLDVCAKLKYVRTRPVGETSGFACPRDTSVLVGIPRQRIATMWGEPDFAQSASAGHTGSGDHWTYFLGRAKPGSSGGGFAEVTLYFAHETIREVDCVLAK